MDRTDPIHVWFNLSYAQYLTIPRSVLQSMPLEWRRQFVRCLEQLDETIDWRPEEGTYKVELREVVERLNADEKVYECSWGKQLDDPLREYNRGRRKIERKEANP